MVEIEVVDVRKLTGDGQLKALANLKIAGAVVVKGFSVMQGKKGVFVSMPRKASKDGRWFDVLEPVSDEVKCTIEKKILERYNAED